MSCLDEIFETLKDNLPPEQFRFFPDALCQKQLQAFKDTVNPHQVIWLIIITVFASVLFYILLSCISLLCITVLISVLDYFVFVLYNVFFVIGLFLSFLRADYVLCMDLCCSSQNTIKRCCRYDATII